MGECGLLRASFVPPEPIRQLRDLTRYRSTLLGERTREAQRLEKELVVCPPNNLVVNWYDFGYEQTRVRVSDDRWAA